MHGLGGGRDRVAQQAERGVAAHWRYREHVEARDGGEINAKVHVMNELIDEACGRVLATVAARAGLAGCEGTGLASSP